MPRRFNTCGEPAGKGGAVDHGADRSTAYRGAAFIGAVAILYLAFLAATGQVAQLVDALRAVQAPWLLAACASMLLYLVLGVAAYAVAVWCDPASPVGVRDLVSVEASGIFFGNLTPMMVGSTPAQIYRLTKAGQSVGEAGAVQFTRFMVYQFGLVAWSALLMAFRLPFFIERCGDIALLCAAAFGMHACILGGILAVGLLPGPIARAARAAIDLAARLGAPLRVPRRGGRSWTARSSPSRIRSARRRAMWVPWRPRLPSRSSSSRSSTSCRCCSCSRSGDRASTS